MEVLVSLTWFTENLELYIFKRLDKTKTYLVVCKKGDVAWVGDSEDLPVPEEGGPRLEQPREHVKLKVRDVVIAREVDSRLQGHGLQAGADRMNLVQS